MPLSDNNTMKLSRAALGLPCDPRRIAVALACMLTADHAPPLI
jgi:hypothetical protein